MFQGDFPSSCCTQFRLCGLCGLTAPMARGEEPPPLLFKHPNILWGPCLLSVLPFECKATLCEAFIPHAKLLRAAPPKYNHSSAQRQPFAPRTTDLAEVWTMIRMCKVMIIKKCILGITIHK